MGGLQYASGINDGTLLALLGIDNWRLLNPVKHGDTLWGIAAAWLGDPLRWPDIYQLNKGHYDQHGRMQVIQTWSRRLHYQIRFSRQP